jgi:hypothetical protein
MSDDTIGMYVEQLVEWGLAGETEVLGENLPQYHFVHTTYSGIKLSRRGEKPATNHLSYSTARDKVSHSYKTSSRIMYGFMQLFSLKKIAVIRMLAFILRAETCNAPTMCDFRLFTSLSLHINCLAVCVSGRTGWKGSGFVYVSDAFIPFVNTFPQLDQLQSTISPWEVDCKTWRRKDLERKGSGLLKKYSSRQQYRITICLWRFRKLQKGIRFCRIPDLRTEIQTGVLPNTKQKCEPT